MDIYGAVAYSGNILALGLLSNTHFFFLAIVMSCFFLSGSVFDRYAVLLTDHRVRLWRAELQTQLRI